MSSINVIKYTISVFNRNQIDIILHGEKNAGVDKIIKEKEIIKCKYW